MKRMLIGMAAVIFVVMLLPSWSNAVAPEVNEIKAQAAIRDSLGVLIRNDNPYDMLFASNLASTDTLTVSATSDTVTVPAGRKGLSYNIKNKSGTVIIGVQFVYNNGADTSLVTVDPGDFARYEFSDLDRAVTYKPASGSFLVRRWLEVGQ